MQTEKVNILELVQYMEAKKEIADKASKESSDQAAISDLIAIFLESVAEVDLGLSFCLCCDKMTDELVNDDDQQCADCAMQARIEAYDRYAYLTRHE